MNYVIDNLFIGSYDDSIDTNQLVKNNILHVINVAKECNHYNKLNNITYHKFDIDDCKNFSENVFNDVFNLINMFSENRENVIIHCKHGMSRSATFVLYYLIKKHNFSLEKSIKYLKKCRNIVDPSIVLINMLTKYDTSFDIKKEGIKYITNIIDISNIDNEYINNLIIIFNYDFNKVINELLNLQL